MTIQTVTFQSKAYPHVKNLYQKAFPKKERIPLFLLVLRARAKWIDFLAFYDKGEFCGLAYLANSDTLTSVLYLAVDGRLQSQGYGSRILQWIQEKYPRHTLALEIEALAEAAENYDQQLRRKQFYLRNGFEETGFGVTIGAVPYEVLKRGASFEQNAWKCLAERLTFRAVKAHLYPLGRGKE